MGKRNAGLAGLLLLGWVSAGLAGQADKGLVDLPALLMETQRHSPRPDEATMVWWLPEEFWRATAGANPAINEAMLGELLGVLRPYTVIAAVDGKMGPFGGVTFKPEADIRAAIRLKDSDGTAYKPLGDDQIDQDTKNLTAAMRSVLAGIAGPLGQNMHFYFFPAKTVKGKPIAAAKVEGAFSVSVGPQVFKWRLPLGSVLPPKTCPKCGEKLNGAYKFCPWDGTPLPEAKEPGDGGPK
jgi:hypothetical protein